MICANCQSDNTTDLCLCPTCASTRVFTHRADCDCLECRSDRADKADVAQILPIAWEEELRIAPRSFPAAA
jgi:hypothetical protein